MLEAIGYAILGSTLVALVVVFFVEQKRRTTSSIALATYAERWISRINNLDVEQFHSVAGTLLGLRSLWGDRHPPTLHHAFPQAVQLEDRPELTRTFSKEDMAKAFRECRAATGLSFAAIQDQIDFQLQVVADVMRRMPAHEVSRQPLVEGDIASEIHGIMVSYPDIMAECVTRPETVVDVLNREGIEVVDDDSVVSYSVFATRSSGKKYVVLKKGLHPAVQLFVLGHELGHWFLHIKGGKAAEALGSDFYLHNYHQWSPLEQHADRVAMNILFPTPYIADLEWRGDPELPVTAEDLLGGLRQEYTDPPKALENWLRTYCVPRIREYHDYWIRMFGIRFPSRAVSEGHLDAFVASLEEDYCWGVLKRDESPDEDWVVADCSERYARDVFGTTRDALLPNHYHLIKDLTAEDHRERIREQMRVKAETQRPTRYFTWFVRPDTGERLRAAVYALPVKNGGICTHTVGIVKLITGDLPPSFR